MSMPGSFKKGSYSLETSTSPSASCTKVSSVIESEITESNIHLVIRNVLSKVNSQLAQSSPSPEKRMEETYEKFALYVNKFLDKNREKVRSLEFARQIRILPTQPLLQAIEVSLRKQNNPLNEIVNLWHAYLKKKFLNLSKHVYDKRQIEKQLVEDIQYGKSLFVDLISNLYRDWIKNFSDFNDQDIEIFVVPELLTRSKDWKYVNHKLEEIYGKLKLNFDRNKLVLDPVFFQMNAYFTGKSLENPFEQTKESIKKFCREGNMVLKMQGLSGIAQALRSDIEKHQANMIEKKEVLKKKAIDVDNLVSCCEYCLLLANEDINYHLNVLEAFYSEQYIDALRQSHFIVCLRAADKMLRSRDHHGKLHVQSEDTTRNLKLESSLFVAKDIGNFVARMSSVRFERNSRFAHCFEFQTLKWIRAHQTNWVSIFSDRPLKRTYEFVVRIHGNMNLMLGIYAQPAVVQQLRNFAQSKWSICVCFRNNRVYNKGNDSVTLVLPSAKTKLQNVIISLADEKISWRLSKDSDPIAIQSIAGMESIYFHAILSSGADIEIV